MSKVRGRCLLEDLLVEVAEHSRHLHLEVGHHGAVGHVHLAQHGQYHQELHEGFIRIHPHGSTDLPAQGHHHACLELQDGIPVFDVPAI